MHVHTASPVSAGGRPLRTTEDVTHTTDTAGQAWAGRTFKPNPFAGDDGSAKPATAAALALPTNAERLAAVVAALRTERVLVPVVAHEHPGRADDGAVAAHVSRKSDDPAGDACASAAMVSVRTPDDRAALPVFSSAEAMKRWNPDARPVPVEGARAAQAAVVETDGLLVLDPAGEAPVLVGRPAVVALATEEPWVAPWADDDLAASLVRLLAPVGGLVGVRLEPGRTAETRVLLAVRAGASKDRVATAVGAAHGLLGQDPVLRARVDSLEITPVRVEG